MKKTLLLLAALFSTALGRAVPSEYSQGCTAFVASYTNALNSALVGTASSTLDLSSTAVVFFRSTGTASTQLGVQWSDTTTFLSPATPLVHDAYCTPKRGRYLRFVSIGPITGRVTAVYYKATSEATVAIADFAELLVDTGAIASTLAGTIDTRLAEIATDVDRTGDSLDQIGGLPVQGGVSITASPVLLGTSRSVEVWLTYTASVKSLSNTVGSTNARCTVCVAPNLGGAGIKLSWGTSYTAPTDLYSFGMPVATSATGQCFGPFAPGINLYVQGSGAAAVSGTVLVDEVR